MSVGREEMSSKIKYLLINFLIFSSLASEQNTQWSYSIEDVNWELNAYTRYNHAKKWTLFLSYTPSKEDKGKKPYFAKHKTKIPNISFYESRDLKSNPFIELKDDGLYIDGKRVCFRSWDKKDYSHWEVLYKVGTKYGKCIENPFISPFVLEFWTINSLAFDNIEGNIGELTHMKKKLYVDISLFKDHYIHLPTEVALRKVFTKEEYHKMMDFLKRYRDFVMTNNIQQIEKFIYEENYFYNKDDKKFKKKELKTSYNDVLNIVGIKRLKELLYRASFVTYFPYGKIEDFKEEAIKLNAYCYNYGSVCLMIKNNIVGFARFRFPKDLYDQERRLNHLRKYRSKE